MKRHDHTHFFSHFVTGCHLALNEPKRFYHAIWKLLTRTDTGLAFPIFLSASSPIFHFLVFHPLPCSFLPSPLERFLLSALSISSLHTHRLHLCVDSVGCYDLPRYVTREKNMGGKKIEKYLNWITFASESVIFPTDGIRLCCFTGTWICGC